MADREVELAALRDELRYLAASGNPRAAQVKARIDQLTGVTGRTDARDATPRETATPRRGRKA